MAPRPEIDQSRRGKHGSVLQSRGAILSVGSQVGFRRAEIAALNVGDLHQNRGFDALRVVRKGGRREALAITIARRR
jgi:hypothetical protein